MGKQKSFLLVVAMNFMISSCWPQNDAGPGYRWELFKGTPEWELAKAAQKEDTSKIYEIIKQGSVNINYREPKYGQTILILAIANNDVNSVDALLKSGADVNVRNSVGNQAIHEACTSPNLRSHSLEIIKLLVNHGADVNAVSAGTPTVPLAGTSSSLACTKLLLDHGANLYFVDKDRTYTVWFFLLLAVDEKNMDLAKYIIVDRKMLVPNPIAYSLAHEPLDIYTILSRPRFDRTPGMLADKKEILRSLHDVDYPNHGAYHE